MSLRRLALAAALGIAVAAAAIAALPLLADSATVRRALERQLSAAVGGEVSYASFSLHYYPPLTARLSDARIDIPGVARGTIGALEVRIALLPLLSGEVRPKALRIERPELELNIARGGGDADPFTAYRAALEPVVAALVRSARGLSLAVTDGKVDVLHAGERRLSIVRLAATADITADAIVVAATAGADRWRSAQVRLRIVPESLAAAARMQLGGLRATELLAAMAPGARVQVRVPSLDVTLDAETDGRSTVRASLGAAAPQFGLARGAGVVDLGALRLDVNARRDAGSLALDMKQFALGALLPAATGTLRARADGAAPVLELNVPALDVAQVRETALALGGDLDAVRETVAPMTAGTLRSVALRAAANDFQGLSDLRAMHADAAVENAAYAIPAAGIAVSNGSGRLVLAGGMLQGGALAGSIGTSTFSDGTLAVQLAPTVALRGIAGEVDADLPEALALTRRLMGRRGDAALARVEALRGRAAGRIAYTADRGRAPLIIDVARMRASGRFRGLPFPLEVSQGALRYSGEHLAIRSLAASVGRSRVQQVAAELTLGTRAAVHAASGTAQLALDELYPWLASLEGLRPLLRDVSGVSGDASVRMTRLSGPLADPAALDFEAAVVPQNVRATLAALPEPLTLASGTLHVTPRTLRMERLAAAFQDASADLSGVVEQPAGAARRVVLDVQRGTLGPQAIAWIDQRWGIPAPLTPLAPIALTAVQVEWSDGLKHTQRARGAATLAGGARADFDLAWRNEELELRRLALKDADSDFDLRLKWAPPAAAELGFKGRLVHRTLVRALATPPALGTRLEGDFRAAIDVRAPLQSTATGTLAAEGLDFSQLAGVPLVIERLNLDADGRRLQVRNAALRVAGERLAVAGSVERRAAMFFIDADVHAETLNAEPLLDALWRERRPGDARRGAAWDLPVEGRGTFAAGGITYSGRTLQQVAGTVTLAPDRVVTQVTKAQLCGIAVPATVTFTPGNVALSARPAAHDQVLAQTLRCLAGEALAVSGNFDFDAALAASAPADALLDALRGDFRFAARAGRIQRSTALSRTLEINEVAGQARTAREALRADGLDYERIILAGSLEGRTVRLEQGTIESPLLGFTASGAIELGKQTVELQGLVAPLDTVSRLARRVPVVGRLFGGSLVVIPVSISGALDDPRVRVLPAAAIGANLVNLMNATLRAPVELLDPLVGRVRPVP